MFDVLIVNPNPLLNLVHTGDFAPGQVNRVSALSMLAEGKGVNVGRFLARHGHSVMLTGFAGGYSGAWLRELISQEGMRDELVETFAPLRVGFMASSGHEDHPTTVLPAGFPVDASECAALVARVDRLAANARLVIMSGSVPHPAADDLYLALLGCCARRGAECWLDAYGAALARALAGPVAPCVCTPNRDEFAHSRDWDRVHELHVTDGASPVQVRRGNQTWRVVPPAIQQVNPIGSGDC